VADIIALVVRELNAVESAGQARAAIASAEQHIDYGVGVSRSLSTFSTPSPEEAQNTLAILRGALEGELRTFGSQADDSPVDPQSWARASRDVQRVYVEVSGIEGAAGASLAAQEQAPQILADAIADAPRVFARGVGEVVSGVGQVAGQVGAGFLSGLGLTGVLVLIVVAALVLRGRFV
jgi:hypothetical protein